MSDTAAISSPRRRRLSVARQAGIALVLAWAALAAIGPYLAPYRAGDVVNVGVFAPMSAAHPFGTDYLGRDMLSRLLHGARYTVGVAMVATVLACMGGIALGILSAVRKGWTDSVLGRTAARMPSVTPARHASTVASIATPTV